MIRKIAHISIAVPNLDRACAFYHDVLGAQIKDRHAVPSQKVEVAFAEFGGQTRIELISPLEENSPVGRFLSKYGPGLHHICLEVDDIDKSLVFLEDHGVKLIDKSPRPGAEDDRIAFLHPASTLSTLIELSEPKKR